MAFSGPCITNGVSDYIFRLACGVSDWGGKDFPFLPFDFSGICLSLLICAHSLSYSSPSIDITVSSSFPWSHPTTSVVCMTGMFKVNLFTVLFISLVSFVMQLTSFVLAVPFLVVICEFSEYFSNSFLRCWFLLERSGVYEGSVFYPVWLIEIFSDFDLDALFSLTGSNYSSFFLVEFSSIPNLDLKELMWQTR
jgi:hypothetical protein